MTYRNIYLIICLFLLISCTTRTSKNSSSEVPIDTITIINTVTIEEKAQKPVISDTAFVAIIEYSDQFNYDMKYAIDDNFLEKAVYSCDKCLVRKEVAESLIDASNFLDELGLKIKFFDCYRPLTVQKQMWEIYPDARYVANPYTTGSIHNKGGAVDITLVNVQGEELDMGTGFDFFGEEAHHAYSSLPDTVLTNRALLKKVMEQYGFQAIKTEWWHYNFKNAGNYALSDFQTECD